MTTFNVRAATMAQLVAFYNQHTQGTPVKRFADRPTAEKRVERLVEETSAELRFADETTHRPYGYEIHKHQVCPACGIDLNNGVGEHNQEVNGDLVKHDKYEFCCLGCGAEFGPAISTKKASVSTGKLRPAMQATLKLDRRIRNVKTGQIWKNAYQMWVANPTWMTSAQVDRLTMQLYSNAKKGYQITITINGRDFSLVQVAA